MIKDISPAKYQFIREDEWLSYFKKQLKTPLNEDFVDDHKKLIFSFIFDFFDQDWN